MRKHIFLSALSALLAAALFLASCSVGDPEETGPVNTIMPTALITAHPTSSDYVAGETIEALEVKAGDIANLTYQWYENTTFSNENGAAISGATASAYTPDMTGKTENFYYVVITQDGNTYTSNPARVRVLAALAPAPAASVAIGNTNAQYVRGFGGMSNGFEISPATEVRYMEVKDIDTMFSPDGLGYNILRIMIWPNPLDDVLNGVVEPQMNNQLTYLEVVKKVNGYGGYVLASPWTPPPEWKINGSEAGTPPAYLLRRYYGAYANYLADFAGEMAKKGAPLYAVSIQNEPTVSASYAGCDWTSQQQLDFFLDVGKFLEGVPGYGGGESLRSVKNMSGEPHQAVTWNDAVQKDDAANACIDIYAYHIYGLLNNPYTQAQQDNDRGRKEVWMTEHNTNSGGGQEQQDYSWDFAWVIADEVDHVIRVNSSNAYVHWYLKRYYGMIGENAYGTVNGAPLPRGYVLSHWAKYAADTVRLPAVVTGHPDGGNQDDTASSTVAAVSVRASAFRRKAAPVSYWEKQVKKQEDSISMVIYNKKTSGGAAQDIRANLPADFGEAKFVHAIISDSTGRRHAPHLIVLNKDKKSADFNLPANSIVSLKFSK